MDSIEPETPLLILQAYSSLFHPFEWTSLLEIALILLFLLISALISGSEIALFSLSPTHIRNMEENGGKRDVQVLSLLHRPHKLLATILIANNFVNVSIVLLSAYSLHKILNADTYPLLTYFLELVVITSMILLLGEIIPKIYASRNPLKFAHFMAGSLLVLRSVFSPLSMLLVKSTKIIERRVSKRSFNISKDDLSDVIELTSSNSETSRGEKELLHSIVKFGDIEVKEIMRARMDVVAVEINTSFKELSRIILDAGFSRMPVYQESFDQIKGILVIKDLIRHIDTKEYQWTDLIRPAYFVPENKKIDDLLREFQEKKFHMAIVVDEYGGTSGIITLEDILEEIVGEISDEFDLEGQDFQFLRVDEKTYIFEGKILLNDVCKILNLPQEHFEKERGESDTLAGLLLELIGQFPVKDQIILHKGFEFKVLSVDNRRIKRIKVTLKYHV